MAKYVDLAKAQLAQAELPALSAVLSHLNTSEVVIVDAMKGLGNGRAQQHLMDLLSNIQIAQDLIGREKEKASELARHADAAQAEAARMRELETRVAALTTQLENALMAIADITAAKDAAIIAAENIKADIERIKTDHAAEIAAMIAAGKPAEELAAKLALAEADAVAKAEEAAVAMSALADLRAKLEALDAENPAPAPAPDPVPAPQPDPVPEPAPVDPVVAEEPAPVVEPAPAEEPPVNPVA